MRRLAFDEQNRVVTLHADPPLSAENFRSQSESVEAVIHRAGEVRGLLVVAEHFPSWRDLADFLSHMRFMNEHGAGIARVAAITASSPAGFLSQMSAHWDQAEVRHFAPSQMRRAQIWVADATAAAATSSQAEPKAVPSPAESEGLIEEGVVVLDEAAAADAQDEDIDDWFVKS